MRRQGIEAGVKDDRAGCAVLLLIPITVIVVEVVLWILNWRH